MITATNDAAQTVVQLMSQIERRPRHSVAVEGPMRGTGSPSPT